MKVTFYKQFHRHAGDYLLESVLAGIKTGHWKASVEAHREALEQGDTARAEQLKKGLPAFTFSATYQGRRKLENLVTYNQVVLLDIDKLAPESVAPLMEQVKNIPYTMFCNRSPGRHGLKIGVRPVVRHALTVENHRLTFQVVVSYYEARLGMVVDPSGKDVGRLCFVSYDPDMYINPLLFTEKGAEGLLPMESMEPLPQEIPMATISPDSPEESKLLLKARKQTSARQKYVQGNRNNYVYHFAHFCRQLGIACETVRAYACRKFPDLDVSEMLPTIDSAYQAAACMKGDQPKKEKKTSREERCKKEIEDMETYLHKLFVFRYNEVICRVEYRSKGSKKPFISMDKLAENTLWCDLHRAGIDCTQKTLHALLVSDFCMRYNPFVDYFNSLPVWDGETDAICVLADTVRTTNQELWRRCLKKWIVAMVACAILPEVENHTVLVLNSAQGKGKTSWCLNLVPPELRAYRYSGIPNPQSRDSMLTLSECILVNFDELGTLPMKELNKLKEMITKGVIRERRAYGENNENYIRRASFTASVNSNQVLSDLTGSRRFLCFEALEIDYLYPVDHTAVFSQAKALLDGGFKYWLGDEDIDEIQENNEAFRARSLEEELFHTWFRKPKPEDSNVEALTAAQILEVLCFKTHLQMSHSGVIRIGMILKSEGYESIRRNKRNVYLVVQHTNEEVSDEKEVKQ